VLPTLRTASPAPVPGPAPSVTLWQCHLKPTTVLSGQPRHPEPPQSSSAPRKSCACSSPCCSPVPVRPAAWLVFPARPFPKQQHGPARAREVLCVTGARGMLRLLRAGPTRARQGLWAGAAPELLGEWQGHRDMPGW